MASNETRKGNEMTTHSKIYWVGFEDGFGGCLSRDAQGFSPQESFAYRRGFSDGAKAKEESGL